MARNRRIKEYTEQTGEVVTLSMMSNFSTDHEGICYRNSNLNPASAEGPQAAMIARELLVDKDGKYVGDDRAIFAVRLNSDNDSTSVSNFIREQNSIIGSSSDNLAEHAPLCNAFANNFAVYTIF